ncbi:MAG: GtrA family protein [Oscillospiraceae bacterium]|nr:GtrA family protein [Oscillospiraceae bacterium]
MKELIDLLRHFRLRRLFIEPTQDGAVQFFRSIFVGGAAFLTDTAVLMLLKALGVHYLIAAAIGFIIGTALNYILTRRFVFAALEPRMSRPFEMTVFLAISLVGLALTELLVWLFAGKLGVVVLLSKTFAAMIVYIWNFFARRFILYR